MKYITGESNKIKISPLCKKVGITRQNYYKHRVSMKKREIDNKFIISLVHRERQIHPRLGARKVLSLIGGELKSQSAFIGRDRFFDLLKENSLLLERKKSKPKTTNSRHTLPVFHNEIKGREITSPNQVWCSDLTYIGTMEGFMYASLITDMYSRK